MATLIEANRKLCGDLNLYEAGVNWILSDRAHGILVINGEKDGAIAEYQRECARLGIKLGRITEVEVV